MTATVPVPVGFAHQMNGWFRRGPEQGGAFQWVQDPPGDSLLPEAIGAVMEVTKWLKPSNSGHDLASSRPTGGGTPPVRIGSSSAVRSPSISTPYSYQPGRRRTWRKSGRRT